MQKITKYKLTPTEHATFKAVADAILEVCKHYDDDCEKGITRCPFAYFCPYACTNGEKDVLSDVVRSIPVALEEIALNEYE